jgi:LPXTG-motif cell wall-anchored protein
MRNKKTRKIEWLVVTLFFILFPFTTTTATQVQQVETNGSIGFTGVYEPIGSPDPSPPESAIRPPITEIAKPGGQLPQTNDRDQFWLIWLGAVTIGFVFILWNRKKKQQTKSNQ